MYTLAAQLSTKSEIVVETKEKLNKFLVNRRSSMVSQASKNLTELEKLVSVNQEKTTKRIVKKLTAGCSFDEIKLSNVTIATTTSAEGQLLNSVMSDQQTNKLTTCSITTTVVLLT